VSPFTTLRNVLSSPDIYTRFQRAVWGRALRELVTSYVRPSPGLRVLDMGCGPGDILRLLPPVEYLGFDLSPRYVDSARRRFGSRAEFLVADVTTIAFFEPNAYDLVLAKGLLHHIDDLAARRLFSLAAKALRPGGKLVTVDGCFHDAQPTLHRMLTGLDRGEHIRRPAEYVSLAAGQFSAVDMDVRDDLLRIPYSLAIATFTR